MSNAVIEVNHLYKQYKLGVVSTGTLSHDLNRWWYRIRGKEDPYEKVTSTNIRTTKEGGQYVWALEDINFKVNSGEALGIIGRNGAGKSTLLKILSKVTGPTKGDIKIKGKIASLLEVGTGFNPELTGRENIFLNGAIMGMTSRDIRHKFDEIVSFSGVEKYIDTPVKRYSSGMYVRLAFAVAAHLEPDIMVVDEVLAVGDAEFQKKCIGKMDEVGKQGRTVLFVSHNMTSILSLCNTAIVLGHGRVELGKSKIDEAVSFYLSQNRKERGKLQNIETRLGLGVLFFTEVCIKDNRSNKYTDIVLVGSSVSIEFHFECKHTLSNVQFDIGLNNEYGDRISWLSTKLVCKQNINLTPSNSCFILEIDKFPFVQGSYSLTLFCTANGELQDWIKEAFYFSVEGGRFYHSGNLPPLNQGNYLVNHAIIIK